LLYARPGEVEEMIKRRPEEREEGRWPTTFCEGEWAEL
jgi:hypothetical protein